MKTSDGWATLLDCPNCGEPCAEIPSCQEAHAECVADTDRNKHPVWCEDRTGICGCGAKLHVGVDDDRAYLVEDEDEV
jgi:hypothetical protein